MSFDSILAKVKLRHFACAIVFFTLHFWYANYLNINHNDIGFGTLSISGATSQQSQPNTTDTNYINDIDTNTLGFIYVPWPQNKLSTLIVQNSDYKIIDLATNIEGIDAIDWPLQLDGNNTNYTKRIFNEYLRNESRRTDKLFCIVQNPYLRVISAFDITSKKKCHPTVLNRDIEKWSKAIPKWRNVEFDNFDFNSLPQYLYINISICDDILYYDTSDIDIINKYKPKFNYKIKCSINDLNYANLQFVNKIYDKDFELFNYSKIIYPTNNNKIWDKMKTFDTLYSVPKFDYKPLKVENISNICKTNPISAKRPSESESETSDRRRRRRRRRTVAQNIESNVKIGLCACVRNELPYLFEWIEYYRTLQQFDKIYIYNDLSQDRVAYLSYFYSEYMWNYTEVEILINPEVEMIDPSNRKQESWPHCRQRALNDNIRWLAVFDVDEFMYSLNFETIKQFIQYIDANEPHINTINVPVTPFGAKISMKKFKYDLNVNQSDKDCVLNSSQILSLSSSLSLDLLNECEIDIINANENGIVTVIGTYLFRAPGVNAGDSKKYVTHLLQDNITNCNHFGKRGREPINKSTICSSGTFRKSISKIPECESLTNHRCETWQSNMNATHFEDIAFIKGNHYFLRGYENLFASYSFYKPDKKIELLDADIRHFFLSIYDPILAHKYHSVLSQRLSKLLRC